GGTVLRNVVRADAPVAHRPGGLAPRSSARAFRREAGPRPASRLKAAERQMSKTPPTRTRMWGFRPIANAYFNPTLKHLAAWLPTFADLTHRGRKTGRSY